VVVNVPMMLQKLYHVVIYNVYRCYDDVFLAFPCGFQKGNPYIRALMTVLLYCYDSISWCCDVMW
jgi:hypothetical protein